MCEFLWFHVCIAIDLISICDDQWWNRLCIVHEVKIVCDQDNLGYITHKLYNFYSVYDSSRKLGTPSCLDYLSSHFDLFVTL